MNQNNEKNSEEYKEEDRLSILERVERGELSIEEAEEVLRKVTEEEDDSDLEEILIGLNDERDEEVEEEESLAPVPRAQDSIKNIEFPETDDFTDEGVPTRRERKMALAERLKDWQPDMMIGLAEGRPMSWQWPWEDSNWKWMWQNFEYPIYVSHSIEVAEGSALYIVNFQGDLFIRGWEKPGLKIDGAVFDIRVGQDENTTRIASSTGQLQVWVPKVITNIQASAKPGDMWLSNIESEVDLHCQSGDLGCEHMKGNIKARVNGGDIRISDVEGSIYINAIRGNTKVRDIVSKDVTLKTTEGDISLNLDSVKSGRFRCENDKGDINLLTNGDLECELLMEATKGGKIAPVILPWQRLLERSESKVHGILKNPGASISLVTQSGRIYIQESWMNSFPMKSSS
ncbi:DUF4097 family beta strand repeat protein [Candidatus Poribacteria bacterium]|nr:DUF4097 family beta strand repeat protein [Candidatus Poribacteria bacterium]